MRTTSGIPYLLAEGGSSGPTMSAYENCAYVVSSWSSEICSLCRPMEDTAENKAHANPPPLATAGAGGRKERNHKSRSGKVEFFAYWAPTQFAVLSRPHPRRLYVPSQFVSLSSPTSADATRRRNRWRARYIWSLCGSAMEFHLGTTNGVENIDSCNSGSDGGTPLEGQPYHLPTLCAPNVSFCLLISS